LLGFLAIFFFVSYLAQLGFFEGAPPPPRNYLTETLLPTASPINSTIKDMWLNWKNLKIITSDPNKKCIILANNKMRISGTIMNDNNFELRNIQIKGFSCPLGTPCIFGNKPYLSSDENTINYLEKMVTPFPLPILTENTIVISSLPAGEITSFTVDLPLPSNSRIYCDAAVVDFSQ
jgi:hypothetical protein